MRPIRLFDVVSIVEGSLSPTADDLEVESVNTDTRQAKPSSLFVAIAGETHDGHDHLAEAKAAGAVAALVHRLPADARADLPLVLVDDTRRAMGRLANRVRQLFEGTVIAVAGSNGKTGTKGLIHAALHPPLRGSASPKSFNNDIGVPLTLFDTGPRDDYVVVELGTNHPGEISALTRIARPDIAVITNVGEEHLEFFGDLDGVRQEEASVVDGLRAAGCLIVNGDDPGLLQAVERFGGRKITFGWDARNELRPTDVGCDEQGISFTVDGTRFFVPQVGRHSAINATAAIAVARRLGLSDDEIARNLRTAAGVPMRLQIQRTTGGVTVINDAYNANPHSMRAALETLRDTPTKGRRIAVLGDMWELGASAAEHHQAMGRFAATCNLDAIYCVGPHARDIAATAGERGLEVVLFDTAAAAGAVVRKKLRSGDLVLLKASRGVQLETVAEAITAADPA